MPRSTTNARCPARPSARSSGPHHDPVGAARVRGERLVAVESSRRRRAGSWCGSPRRSIPPRLGHRERAPARGRSGRGTARGSVLPPACPSRARVFAESGTRNDTATPRSQYAISSESSTPVSAGPAPARSFPADSPSQRASRPSQQQRMKGWPGSTGLPARSASIPSGRTRRGRARGGRRALRERVVDRGSRPRSPSASGARQRDRAAGVPAAASTPLHSSPSARARASTPRPGSPA